MIKNYMHTTKWSLLFSLLLVSNLIFAQTGDRGKTTNRVSYAAPWSDARNQGIKEELTNKRSRFTKHFIKNDGTFKMYSSPGSIHYNDGTSWKEIDPSVKTNTTTTHTSNPFYNGDNSFKTYYPNDPINGKIFTKLKEGEMSENLNGIYAIDQNENTVYQYQSSASNATVEGNVVSYTNIFPHTTVRYSQNSDGRKFDIQLLNAQALNVLPSTSKYLVIKETINLPSGWTITETTNGFDIYKGTSWLANFPAPVAYETQSSSKQYNKDEDFMKQGSMSMIKNGNTITLLTKFAIDWLKSAERNFPISLDPIVNYYPANVPMATGYMLTSTSAKASGNVRLSGAGQAISWAQFDITTLPPSPTITMANYWGYHFNGTVTPDKIANIIGMQSVDPITALAAAINTQINTAGPVYSSTYVFGGNTVNLWRTGTLSGSATGDIATQQSQGWTALGFRYLSGAAGAVLQRPYTDVNKPYLEIDYSTGACSAVVTGTANSSVLAACGDPFTLSLTGNTSGAGMTYQWQSSPAGTNIWTNLGAPQISPFYTTTQSSATDYRAFMVCLSSGLSDTSTVVAVAQNSVFVCYCIPTGPASNPTNYISNFSTSGAGVNVSNPNNIYTTAPVAGYGDYTAMTVAAVPGATLNYTISAIGTNLFGLWIDWNQDGDFNDPSENVSTTASGSFTVPALAVVGNTRLRIRVANTAPGPCGAVSLGEAEDYTFNVIGPCTIAGAGTVTPATSVICPLTTKVLVATVPLFQTGITYQWKESMTAGGPYTNVVGGTGATTLNYTTASLPAGTYYYVMETTCANCGPCSSLSNEVSILSEAVNAPTGTNSAQCAPGIPTASVVSTNSAAVGTGIFNWYSAATGGTLLQGQPYGPLQSYYFNDFSTAVNGTLTGNAALVSGTVRLTENGMTGQYGAYTVNASGYNSNKMKTEFDFTTVGTTITNMADGFSYSYSDNGVSTDESTVLFAENGTGNKVKLCFVAYTNGANQQGIYLMYNNTTNEAPSTTLSTATSIFQYSSNVTWKNTANNHVIVNIDSLGKATVTLNGVNVFTNVQLPTTGATAYTTANKSTWKHIWKGRTGAISMSSILDNISIQLSTLVPGSTTYNSSVATTTTFYVSELGTNGCLSPRTPVTITVNTPPTLSITPTPNDSVCTGAPVTLTATGASTYLWNGSATSVNGDTTFASAIAGIYTVTGTDGNGCINTSTILIYLHPVLSGTATATPTSVCLGTPINLTATATPVCTGLYTNSFINYYTPANWTFDNFGTNGTLLTTGSPANVKLNTGTAGPSSGGVTSFSRVITCAGTVTLNWSFMHPLDAYADLPQYRINGGPATDFPTYNQGLFATTQTGTMSIPVNDGDSLSILVVTIDNDAASGQLTITNFAAPSPKINGLISYWDAPTGGTNLGTPPFSVTPTIAGTVTYYAEYTSSTTGCVNLVRQPVSVTVNVSPTATVTGGGTICAGSPLPDVMISLTGTGPWDFTYTDGTTPVSLTGIATSPYVITNAAPGIYSVSSVNDIICTGNGSGTVSVVVNPLPTATLSGGGSVCTGGVLPDVSIALTGTAPWNIIYTDGTTSTPINAIATSPYVIMNATPGTYSVTSVNDMNCANTGSGTIDVIINTLPTVTATMTPSVICSGSTAVATGGGAATYVWDNGISNNVAFVGTTSGTYMVIGTDANGCTGSSSTNLTINTNSTNLSQSSGGNSTSVTGSENTTNIQPDGSMVIYSDASCNLIASVQDQPGGNSLGSTMTMVTVDPSVQTYNSQPYSRRWYTITPTNNTGVDATVVLYQTQDDFDDYNAANGAYPDLPTGPLDASGILNVTITKVSGGILGVGTGSVIVPSSVVFNATTNYWEITFTVTGTFSHFYIHGANPLGSALPATVTSFTGYKEQSQDVLTWTTASEQNNAFFNLQHSTDGMHFTTISKVNSLAVNGNSSSVLKYKVTDNNPAQGHNYYRLEQVDIDGHRSFHANIVDLIWAGSNTVNIYPNPVNGILNIDLYTESTSEIIVKVMDISGRSVKQVQSRSVEGVNTIKVDMHSLTNGLYTIQLFENGKAIFVERINKD